MTYVSVSFCLSLTVSIEQCQSGERIGVIAVSGIGALNQDILVFDPVHCYGLPGYLQIIELLEKRGWPRSAFWPHGGHLFCLHIVAALGLGGAEVNPLCFQPFGGYGDETSIANGTAIPPELPGIGFETKPTLRDLLATLVDV